MLRLLTCAGAVLLLAVGVGVAAAVSQRGQRNRVAALQRLASVATTDSNTELGSLSPRGTHADSSADARLGHACSRASLDPPVA